MSLLKKSEVTELLREYQAARNERLKLDQASAKLKVTEDSLLDKLVAAKVESGKYGPYLLTSSEKLTPRCTDWPGFWSFVRENNAFELMHKRLTESALVARREAGDVTPGIVFDVKPTFKITAA